MLLEDGLEFDIKPREPSWRPYQGVLPPRLKMRLGARIDQGREMLASDSFDDAWELAGLEAIAAGHEPFWIGKA